MRFLDFNHGSLCYISSTVIYGNQASLVIQQNHAPDQLSAMSLGDRPSDIRTSTEDLSIIMRITCAGSVFSFLSRTIQGWLMLI